MIDMNREPLLGLGQASRLVPARNGKPVSPSTIWRWANHGYRGIKLETVRKPSGDHLTSAAAVGRFLRAIADLKASEGQVLTEDEAERRRQGGEWADAVLDSMGV